jgi:phospholipid/cholesterol/gamma-HCH transport system substrate-binding protein
VAAPLAKLLVFAAVTLALTGLLAQTLGSLDFTGGTTYRARFTDVTGLLPGDDIRVAGVRVGRVDRISLVDSVAEVSFTVDSSVPLNTGVRAAVRYRNLVGQRYIALTEGPGGPVPLPPGGLIPLGQTRPALDLTVVFNGFRPLFTGLNPDDVNKLAFEIVQVLQGEGGTLLSLLNRTASLTGTLADRDAAIGRVIDNLNAVLATVAARDDALDTTIAQLRRLVSGLAADRAAIGGALGSLADLTSATGSLLHDARPDLARDITLLDQLAGTLDDNSQTIETTLRTLPGRYAALTRTATTGSWFNFFVCDFDGRVGLVPGVDAHPAVSSAAARCRAGGGS